MVTPLVRPYYALQTRMYIRDYLPSSALAVYYSIFQSARTGCTATSACHTLLRRCTQGGTLPERKRLAWLLAAPESGPFSLIQNSFCAMSAHSIIRMCVVHGGLHCRRKAGASKWTKSRPSGPSSSSCLLFRVPKMGPKTGPKNGAAILPEEGNASKMAAPFLGPGCCIHSQPPSACSE